MKFREIHVWGSVLTVELSSTHLPNAKFEPLIDTVEKFAHRVDDLFSTYKENSTISQIRSGAMSIDDAEPEVIEVWNACAYAREITEGAFNPWAVAGGFDPSGYVKGWAADVMADMCVAGGAQHVMINASGDLTLRGGAYIDGEVGPWKIGVSNPENPEEVLKVFEIFDGAIATSGTYERGGHIIDPRGGLPAIGAISATVVGPDGGLADALATAVVVDGTQSATWIGNEEISQYKFWAINRNEASAWSFGPT